MGGGIVYNMGMGKILSVNDIKKCVETIAKDYDLTRVTLFGSYADGRQTAESDVDLLVEFTEPAVSLFDLVDLQLKVEEILGKNVDIIHAPIPAESIIEIGKEVLLYVA